MLEIMFPKLSVLRCYKQDNWIVMKYYPAGNDMSAEAEESPLLEAITRKRLVGKKELVCPFIHTFCSG
jgi:hypothetical protein